MVEPTNDTDCRFVDAHVHFHDMGHHVLHYAHWQAVLYRAVSLRNWTVKNARTAHRKITRCHSDTRSESLAPHLQ